MRRVDPTYLYIEDGEWQNDESYVTIHRIASDQKVRGIIYLKNGDPRIAFQWSKQ